MDPMEIIFPELWEQIFGQVNDAQDWLNLYRASSSSFGELVGAERTNILFPLVLPHIQHYLKRGRAANHEIVNQLLPLRLVSHKWRESVDTLIEETLVSQGGARLSFDKFRCFSSKNVDRITSFLNKFESHSWNPIPFGHVTLDYRHPSTVTEFDGAVERLMARFGKGVRAMHLFEFGPGNSGFSARKATRRLTSLAPQIPHLEHLRLTVVAKRAQAEEALLPRQEGAEEEPLLTNLKSLAIQQRMENIVFGEDFQNLWLTKFCSPNTLQKVDFWGVPSELARFPNLTSATFRFYNEQHLSTLSNFSWPLLSELNLSARETTVQELFRHAQHFKTTLSSLGIMQNSSSDKNVKFRVDFPALKQLFVSHFTISGIYGNLPNLEVLETVWLISNNHVSNEREILESAIWQECPKLRKVILRELVVSMKVFTRELVDAHWRRLASQVGEYHSWHLIQKVAEKLP